jgi:CheY-like chemotaxis protein
MIIDDDEFFGTVLQEVLETSGLPLWIKSNRDPLCALVEIGQFHPDLIIIDYCLGDINGLKIVEKLSTNSEFTGIPIIVISGYMDDIVDQESYGVAAFLKKPFKSSELRETVMKCLQMEHQKKVVL